jgi:hypothetical protein
MKTILEIVGVSAVLLLIAFIAIDRNKRDEGFIIEPQDRAGLVYEEDGIIHNYSPYEEDEFPKSDIVFPKSVPEECFVFITDPNIIKITMTIPNNVETMQIETMQINVVDLDKNIEKSIKIKLDGDKLVITGDTEDMIIKADGVRIY